MTSHVQASEADYFAYLRRRSRLGLAYRSFWLYPRLARQLAGRALDFGCGIGDFLAYRPDTVGVEVNRQCVDHCRARGLEAHLIEQGRAPFEAAAFDSAVLDNVLEHLDDPAVALDELYRLVRPGGTLVIGVPTEKGYASDPDHKVFYDRAALIATTAQFGFATQAVFRMPLPLSALDRRLAQQCLYGRFERR